MTELDRPVRPDMRPEAKTVAKELTSRERAEARLREYDQHNLGNQYDDTMDDFAIDEDIKPDGWTYEWKTLTVMGKEDPAYQVALAKRGWEPVPRTRHPELMPVGSDDPNITRRGMILMERPAELTARARDLDYKRARQQVRFKEEQLAAASPGQFERSNKDSPLVKVKKGYEKMDIPE